MKGIKIILSIGCFAGIVALGQAQDSVKRRNFEKEFNDFKSSVGNDFLQQSQKNDSIFRTYLNASWKEFEVFTRERVKRVKPELQPLAPTTIETIELPPPGNEPEAPVNDTGNKQAIPPAAADSELLQGEEGLKIMELNSIETTSGDLSYFDFLGQKVGITQAGHEEYTKQAKPDEKKTRIIRFYEQYSKNESWKRITLELYLLAQVKQLNDWGYYYLLSIASENIFHNQDEQVLFTWLSLLRNGINARIAYNKEAIFVLAAFEQPIYNAGTVTIMGKDYYLLNRKNEKIPMELQSYEANYPGTVRPVSVSIKTLPKLANAPEIRSFIFDKDTLRIRINLSLIHFYSAYPDCDLPVYFNTPLSAQARESFDAALKPMITGKDETERVNILLKFVQDALPYKLDLEQFGREKYFFADEALHYPYTDCEDRAVLFAKLVYLYTGLEAIGLEYPDHVSVAVRLNEPITGAFVVLNKQKYYVCDPTYMGAREGMAMDGMKKQSPTIIVVDQYK